MSEKENSGNPFLFVPADVARETRPGRVAQIRILGILGIVHNSLVLCFGLFYVALALFITTLLAVAPNSGATPPPPQGIMLIRVIYGATAALCLSVGGFGLFGSIRTLQLRSRTAGLVALWTGLLSLLTCYCFPTAAGLLVFGLIVLTDSEVVEAFQLRESGVPQDEVLRKFGAG